MPLLIQIAKILYSISFPIYIPLCLYLYQIAWTMVSWSKTYLHSTMPLLIRTRASERLHPLKIYIPLCLYLYSSGLSKNRFFNQIYIPLCLYLYLSSAALSAFFHCYLHSTMPLLIQLCGLSGRRPGGAFTFHYASTYTAAGAGRSGRIYTFTFHYASTYTSMQIFFIWTLRRIYIPLCLYLYLLNCNSYNLLHLFTFHYASTYTRRAFPVFEMHGRIYIPLCLYLYNIQPL